MFVGTECGKILLYKWPLNDFHYAEYQLHTAAIIRLILTQEEQFLFSVGADGSLFMCEIECFEDGKAVAKKPFKYEVS